MSAVVSSDAQSPAAAVTAQAEPALEGAALKERIQFQCEYYLSRENLARDAYLVSMMDKDSFVSIEVLASFQKLQLLTMDAGAIVEALRASKLVELDATGTKVKPRTKPQRNTIILREISSQADPTAVMAIFASNGSGVRPPPVREVRAEVGDNWFAVFADETSALEALNWLRTATFNGEPVRARMKTDSSALRSYYQAPAAGGAPAGALQAPLAGAGGFVPNGQYYQYAWDPNQQQQQGAVPQQPYLYSEAQQQQQQQQSAAASAQQGGSRPPRGTGAGRQGGKYEGGRGRGASDGYGAAPGGRGRQGGPGGARNGAAAGSAAPQGKQQTSSTPTGASGSATASSAAAPAQSAYTSSNANNKKRFNSGSAPSGSAGQTVASKAAPEPELNMAQFPPLPPPAVHGYGARGNAVVRYSADAVHAVIAAAPVETTVPAQLARFVVSPESTQSTSSPVVSEGPLSALQLHLSAASAPAVAAATATAAGAAAPTSSAAGAPSGLPVPVASAVASNESASSTLDVKESTSPVWGPGAKEAISGARSSPARKVLFSEATHAGPVTAAAPTVAPAAPVTAAAAAPVPHAHVTNASATPAAAPAAPAAAADSRPKTWAMVAKNRK